MAIHRKDIPDDDEVASLFALIERACEMTREISSKRQSTGRCATLANSDRVCANRQWDLAEELSQSEDQNNPVDREGCYTRIRERNLDIMYRKSDYEKRSHP